MEVVLLRRRLSGVSHSEGLVDGLIDSGDGLPLDSDIVVERVVERTDLANELRRGTGSVFGDLSTLHVSIDEGND